LKKRKIIPRILPKKVSFFKKKYIKKGEFYTKKKPFFFFFVILISSYFSRMWYVYIVRCADDRLYTGITTNIKRRITEHNASSKGAKYTRVRRPVVLVFFSKWKNRSEASREEARIKKMTRKEKEVFIKCRYR